MNFSGISDKTCIGRLLRWPLQYLPRDLAVPIVQGTLKGQKWIVGSSTHGCWLGSYEFEKQELFVKTILPSNVVFDIGANVGFYTILASRLVREHGYVCAFEPLPRNLDYLKKHIQLNQCKNVRVFPVAVGDNSGPGCFEEGGDSSTGRLSLSSSGMAVSVVSLDDLFSRGEIPLPDCVKIDIEGAELQALLGARVMLQARHPIIFLATHGDNVHQQCCRYLADLGYQLTPITGNSLSETDEILAITKSV